MASSVPPNEAAVYIQELGTFLYLELVEDSPWTILRIIGVFLLLATRRKPDSKKKGKKTITFRTDTFVPLAAVTQQKVTPSSRHDLARGTPVPDQEAVLTIQEFFTENMIDDEAVLVRKKNLRPKKKLGRSCFANSVVTDAGGDPSAKDRTGQRYWNKQSQQFHTKGRSQQNI